MQWNLKLQQEVNIVHQKPVETQSAAINTQDASSTEQQTLEKFTQHIEAMDTKLESMILGRQTLDL